MHSTPARASHLLSRREFATGLAASALALTSERSLGAEPGPASSAKWRAVIIGHTGQGDYGHSLDVVFNGCASVQTVAVADPDAAGRGRAAQRCGAPRQFADYREMIEQEKPNLVCLAPRWTNHRHAMAMAALRVGAHLFTEKPFTTTLAEADEILATAATAGLRIAVAHQMRSAPGIINLQKALGNGLIGDLLKIRAWGKQDDRAGGEDMIVLGSHLFDLMRCFAGDAFWCSARVSDNGRDITKTDARAVKEQIGLVAGNEIEAQFAFGNGVTGTFISHRQLRQTLGPWGMELVGSKGMVRILTEIDPSIYLLKPGRWESEGKVDRWERWEGDPAPKLPTERRGFGPANRRIVDDWLEAIQGNRDPLCSGRAAMKSLEIIMAVYRAALSGARVALPLAGREHPLGA